MSAWLKLNVCYHRRFRSNDGFGVADESWDNHISLDGSRNDIFERSNHLDDHLGSVIALGRTGVEFLKENFYRGQYQDIVYVLANPYRHKLPSGMFQDIYNRSIAGWHSGTEMSLAISDRSNT